MAPPHLSQSAATAERQSVFLTSSIGIAHQSEVSRRGSRSYHVGDEDLKVVASRGRRLWKVRVFIEVGREIKLSCVVIRKSGKILEVLSSCTAKNFGVLILSTECK